MKKRIIPTSILILFLPVFCASLRAMQFDANTIAEITTDPNHQVNGFSGGFAVSGNVAVWIDQRDPSWIPRIYGVRLDDPCHQEFLIDINAPSCYRLAMSGPVVAYNVRPTPDADLLRVVDITDQNNLFMFDFWPLIPYVSNLDVSGRIVAYSGSDPNNGYLQTVYAADISDANNIRQYVTAVLPTDHYISGLAIDANHIIWSANCYEPNAYVQVADIANPNEPNVMTAFLPEKTGFDTVDASGDWLTAHGRYDWQDRVYGVHNYFDGNNWNVIALWEQYREYFSSGPRIDGPIAVWVVNTRMPGLGGQPGLLQQTTEYMLKAAYLTGNGGFTVSTLIRDTNEIYAADIWKSRIVWSKVVDSVTDLFKGLVMLECGDWGYKSGDLNRDCKVDFTDFAVFAEDWLGCTMSDDPNCGYGSFR
jgi:hypothetical protein